MRTALLSVVVLLLVTAGARAETVDWSNYMDDGTRVTKVAGPSKADAAPTVTNRATRATKPAKSVANAKAKARKAKKAKAKKAKAKKRGRR